jgi:hypothetical protein
MFIPSLTISSPAPGNGTATTAIIESINSVEPRYRFILPPCDPQRVSAQSTNDPALDDIAALKDNWDGYGALAPTRESCSYARSFLANATDGIPIPEVNPTSNGTINLEWKSDSGTAFFEIGKTRYSGHIEPRRGSTIFFEGQLSEAQWSLATQQVLAIVKQLLYGATGSRTPAYSVRFTEPTL